MDIPKASKPLSSGGMTNCITQHGEWRYKTKRGRLVHNIGKTEYDMPNVLVINDRYWVYCGDVRFYQNNTYTGFRLKQLK